MTKYRIRPDYICTAFRITEIRGHWENGNIALTLENGDHVEALPDMTARCKPRVGDYWVISPDGYTYLNPKAVFEDKHIAIETLKGFTRVDGSAPAEAKVAVDRLGRVQVYDADKPQQGLLTMTPEEEAAYANKEAAKSTYTPLDAMKAQLKPKKSRASRSPAAGGVRSSNSKKAKK